MNTLSLYYTLTTLSFLLVLLTGRIVTVQGAPYKQSVLVIHKILSLAFITFFVVVANKWLKIFRLNFTETGLLIALGTVILTALATGGKLSHENKQSNPLRVVHKAVTALIIVLTALLMCLCF